MNSKIVIVCSFTFLLCNSHSSAQDVRAATYQWIQDDSFVLVDNILKLYVDSALDLQRSSVIMSFDGGGHVLDLYSSESVEPGITCHTFKKTQLYPGPGVFPHVVDVPFRVGQIENFNQVDNITMELQPIFISNPIFGYNSTPLCNNLQSDIIQSANGATYTPSFSDMEGDSLVFSLTDCSGPGYYIPSGCSIDPATGVITADPPEPGLYAFCTKVEEFRSGANISTTYTDMVMQIDNVTSVGQLTGNTGWSLFPNLLQEHGSITVHAPGTAILQVFDASGKRVVQREVLDGKNIDLNVVKGVYMYVLQDRSGTGVLLGKIVVL
jgi:hypothetical protein